MSIKLSELEFAMDMMASDCFRPNEAPVMPFTEIQDMAPTLDQVIEASLSSIHHEEVCNFGPNTVDIVGQSFFHILLKTGQYVMFVYMLGLFSQREEALRRILSLKNRTGWTVRSYLKDDAPEPLKSEILALDIENTPHTLPVSAPVYKPQIEGLLIEYPELFLAVTKQDLVKIQNCLLKGVPIHSLARTQDGAPFQRTILEAWVLGADHRIANPAVLDLLLAHGMDINAKTSEGLSVVKQALRELGRSTQTFVALLIERGAKLDQEDLANCKGWINVQVKPEQIIPDPLPVKKPAANLPNPAAETPPRATPVKPEPIRQDQSLPKKPVARLPNRAAETLPIATPVKPEPIHQDQLPPKKPVARLPNRAAETPPRATPRSCLSQTQIVAIDKLIQKLQREHDSRWPYPNKQRKQRKIDALTELKDGAQNSENIADVITAVEADPRFYDIRVGSHSGIKTNRTDELLTDLAEGSRLTASAKP